MSNAHQTPHTALQAVKTDEVVKASPWLADLVKRFGNEWTLDQLATLRMTVAPKASPHVFLQFLEVAKAKQLDVFTKQIHCTEQGQVIIGIDGFRALAERTKAYRPGAIEFVEDGNKVIAAKATVFRRYDSEWHPVTETAYMEEFNTFRGQWSKMPRVMLGKCAEARAIRRAFPQDMASIYTNEEMDQATVVVEEKTEQQESAEKDAAETSSLRQAIAMKLRAKGVQPENFKAETERLNGGPVITNDDRRRVLDALANEARTPEYAEWEEMPAAQPEKPAEEPKPKKASKTKESTQDAQYRSTVLEACRELAACTDDTAISDVAERWAPAVLNLPEQWATVFREYRAYRAYLEDESTPKPKSVEWVEKNLAAT